jgi:hypothetical protein
LADFEAGGLQLKRYEQMTEAEKARFAANHRVYVKQDTPAGEAWAAWTRRTQGKGQVWDSKGGWWFPHEWPQDHG